MVFFMIANKNEQNKKGWGQKKYVALTKTSY
jgi:hypothetical protein